MQQHFVETTTLEGNNLTVADVNASSSVNSTDALLIQDRFINTISSFVTGDWYFTPAPVTVNTADVTQNIYALCFGDVNGSYTPPSAKSGGAVNISHNNSINLPVGTVIEVPVTASETLEVGAISLVLNYPSDKINVLNVTAIAPGMTDLRFNIINGQVRIAWCNIQPLNLNTDDVLFTVEVQAISSEVSTINFMGTSENEFANATANVYSLAHINTPAMMLGITNSILLNENIFHVNVFPNPITEKSVVGYTLPETGNVTVNIYDMNGKMIQVMTNQKQTAGYHSITIDAENFAEGIYQCFLSFDNGSDIISNRKSIAVIK